MKTIKAKKTGTKKVTVDIPENLLQALDIAAKQNGRDRAKQIRFVLACSFPECETA